MRKPFTPVLSQKTVMLTTGSEHRVFLVVQGFPFLLNQIRDQLNLRQTCNIIYSLTRWNDSLAVTVWPFLL